MLALGISQKMHVETMNTTYSTWRSSLAPERWIMLAGSSLPAPAALENKQRTFLKPKLSPEATSRCSTHTTENYKRRVADKAFWHLWIQPSEPRTTGRESLYQIRTSPAPEEEKQKLQSEHQGIDHYRTMGAIILPVCFWTGFHLLSV